MKRFYENVDILKKDNQFYILLDKKIIKTPHKNDLTTDNVSIAEAMKEEWMQAEEKIIADKMPVTKYVNTLIDCVIPQRDAMNALLVAYINHDSLCYFSGVADEEFHAIQEKSWLPVIQTFNNKFSLNVTTTSGIMPLIQDEKVIGFAQKYTSALPALEFMVFYQLVTISGSFILAALILSDAFSTDKAFALSFLEEDRNSEKWGEDPISTENRAKKKQEWRNVLMFWEHFRQP